MIKMKSLLPELKVTTLTTNDDSCYFIVYKDNLFIVDDSSDLDKLAPYFVEHPQMDRCGDWGNPFNAVEDFDEFINRMMEFAPDILVGRYDKGEKTIYLNTNQQFSPTSSLLLKKVVKQLGIKHVTKAEFDGEGDEVEQGYSKKKILGRVPDIIYHGTTSKYLGNILRYGLKPNESDSNFRQQKIYNPNEVFFAADFNISQFYAFNARGLNGGIPIILQMGIPDKDLLKPDFDADTSSTQPQYYAHKGGLGRQGRSDMSSVGLSREQGKWGYSGRIPASFIQWIYVYRENDKKWIKLKPTTVNKLLSNDGFYRYGIEM